MKLPVVPVSNLNFILLRVVSATPSTPSHDLSSLSANSNFNVSTRTIHCYGRMPYVLPPTKEDCEKAIDRIFQNPDIMTIKTWSVPEKEAPAAAWKFDSCIIEIRVWKITPQEVAQDCIGREKGGGRSVVGPKGVFQVIVMSIHNLAVG